MDKAQQRAWLSWASVGLLAVLCGLLAVLQNNWIREISRAEKERLQNQLQTELNHLSREFNSEITSACSDLLPDASQVEELGREKAYSVRYSQWKESHDRIFSRMALAVPQGDSLDLFNLDLATAQFSRADWPSTWASMRGQLMAHLTGGGFDAGATDHSTLIDIPRFDSRGFGPRGFGPPRFDQPGPYRPGFDQPRPPDRNVPAPRRPGEQDWLIVELNLDYVR